MFWQQFFATAALNSHKCLNPKKRDPQKVTRLFGVVVEFSGCSVQSVLKSFSTTVVVLLKIGAVIAFAKTFKRYVYDIINHCKFPIHTSRMNGINKSYQA